MAVYLLHATEPLVQGTGRLVRHYLGYCDEGTFERRLWEHYQGRHSARIVAAFLAKGAELWLGNYWAGLTRDDERRMKTNGHLEEKCLVCRLDALQEQLARAHGTAIPSRPTLTERSGKLPNSGHRRAGGEVRLRTRGRSLPTPRT